jgi:hypothetical protein
MMFYSLVRHWLLRILGSPGEDLSLFLGSSETAWSWLRDAEGRIGIIAGSPSGALTLPHDLHLLGRLRLLATATVRMPRALGSLG